MSNRNALAVFVTELECEQEEIEECGDLEDRLEIAVELETNRQLFNSGVNVKWWPCTICNETGKVSDGYDDFDCKACKGRLGHFLEAN